VSVGALGAPSYLQLPNASVGGSLGHHAALWRRVAEHRAWMSIYPLWYLFGSAAAIGAPGSRGELLVFAVLHGQSQACPLDPSP
jgi:hypothetical protein